MNVSLDISKLKLEGEAKEVFEKLQTAINKIPGQYHDAVNEIINHVEALSKHIQDKLNG